MTKLYDAAEKMSDMEVDIPSTGKKGEPRKYYPHLDINSEAFPMIKDMKVGEKCMLMVEVKPVRVSTSESEGKKDNTSMCMEIRRIGMADDQEAGKESSEKVDKMVEKMYPKDDKK
jgi:hypothetical protein